MLRLTGKNRFAAFVALPGPELVFIVKKGLFAFFHEGTVGMTNGKLLWYNKDERTGASMDVPWRVPAAPVRERRRPSRYNENRNGLLLLTNAANHGDSRRTRS